MGRQVLFQGTMGLDEEAAIDGLVRHLALLMALGMCLQPASNLHRRPVLLQLGGHALGQPRMQAELADLRPARTVPCTHVSLSGPMSTASAVALDLATNRGRCTMELLGE